MIGIIQHTLLALFLEHLFYEYCYTKNNIVEIIVFIVLPRLVIIYKNIYISGLQN